MAIVISNDQNTVMVNGVKLVAIPVAEQWKDDDSGCDGCYFAAPDADCRGIPCNAGNRDDDDTDVIFKQE